MATVIPSEDNLFRGVHHPVAFRRDVFRSSKFMKLFNEPDPSTIEASFIWQRFAPCQRHLHAYGCRTSKLRNQKKPKSRDVYCGAYQLRAASIRSLAGAVGLPEIRTADIRHQIENNQIAHAALCIELQDGIDQETAEGIKTAIVDHLWKNSRGPLRHVCRNDRDLTPHPSNNLEPAPLGMFVDSRPLIRKISYVVRFWWSWCCWKVWPNYFD